ncbi:MAG TPA: ABC transporter ATP-binding protein [Candidatus Methylomirabilis sp.]|nr:ABC transporter ATP-binding protein [Candidatus Methylomirabilis sp.]
MTDRPLLSLDGLTKRYGALTAVDNVSAAIHRGELVSFVGPSGCGKTTLLRLIGGFLRPDAGSIVLDGENITALPPNRRPTAMVFQNYALFPHLTVAQNIGYALAIRKRPRAEIARRVEELLVLVQLQGINDRRPVELSGGQQQRVALARALSLQPKVLLLDEPLSNLDANLRVQMRAEITRLQRDLQQTVVFVTHDQEEAMSISDRIMVMNQGRILQTGTPTEIYERPATEFVARFVGVVNFLDGSLRAGASGSTTVATRLGPLAIRSANGRFGPGDRVFLVVRPEAVRLGPYEETVGPNRLPGTIESAVYTGSLVRYTVNVGGTRLAVDLSDPRHTPAFVAGDRVTVILPEDPHLLSETDHG